jgi:hypothetical protein
MVKRDTVSRRLRVLLIMPIARRVAPQDYTPGTQPDPFDQWQQLSQYGVDVEMVHPTPWPLNPWAGQHSFYQSIDPYRALKTLLFRRNYHLVIVDRDGRAAILVMLRRVNVSVAMHADTPRNIMRALLSRSILLKYCIATLKQGGRDKGVTNGRRSRDLRLHRDRRRLSRLRACQPPF